MLLVAVAVAALVDVAAKRARQARTATREAELLALFAGSVLRGADLPALLERVRGTYRQRAVSLVGGKGEIIAAAGAEPPASTAQAHTAIEVGDGEYWLLMAGAPVDAGHRRVLNAVAGQAAGLVRQRQLNEEASKAKAVAAADELRRALLSAVSHDLRTPLAAAKAAVSSLRGDDITFSPEDTAELLATVEESVDQLTGLVGNLLDSSRLAAGAVRPQLRQVYLEEAVNRALVSVGMGVRGIRHDGLHRVKVNVGALTVRADAGLLERVIANLVDNALRYAPESPIRIDAAETAERVVITVADEGPGIPASVSEQLFDPLRRMGDRDNTTGAGLGLSVVRGFVAAMGGTVQPVGTPGGGLTMIVELQRSTAA
jgi:two-component system sensor histidine kinase KdpD